MSGGIEQETKVALDEGVVLPDLGGLGVTAVDAGTETLEAAYWDTGDLALSRARLGLRRRVGRGWTFKGPSTHAGDALVREEVETADSEAIPEALRARVEAVIGSVELEVVARIRTQRHRITLHDAEGAQRAEIDDDIVSVIGSGGAEVDRFREVEVEVAEAASAPLAAAVVERLVAAGGTVHSTGKYTRALRALGRI